MQATQYSWLELAMPIYEARVTRAPTADGCLFDLTYPRYYMKFCSRMMLAGALCMGVAAAAQDRHDVKRFAGPGQVVFTGTPTSTGPKYFLEEMEKTIQIQATPLFGGAEDISPPRVNLLYNSVPYGNCGVLNTMGASLFTFLTGTHFRYRSTSQHVLTEVLLNHRFFVLDSYTGSALTTDRWPGLFTLEQLADGGSTWNGDLGRLAFLFEKVVPLTGNAAMLSAQTWRRPELLLKREETLEIKTAHIDSLDLVETPGMTLRDLPLRTTLEVNHGIWPLRIATLSRPVGAGITVDRLAPPFFVTKVSLRPVEWASPPGRIFKLAGAARVFPESPPGAIDLLDRARALNVQTISGKTSYAADEMIVQSEGATSALIRFESSYTNRSNRIQYGWLPFLYRSPTPSRHGDGQPVGSIIVPDIPWFRINFYTRRRDMQYVDLLIPIAPGKKAAAELHVFPTRIMQLHRPPQTPEITDVLSPLNPAMAVRTAMQQDIVRAYRGRIFVSYEMFVNPYLLPELRARGKQ